MRAGQAGLALTAGFVAALSCGEAVAQNPGATPTEPDANSHKSAVPEGFENLDSRIETVFDIYMAGRRVAAAPGRLENGQFVFHSPEELTKLLPGVDVFATAGFLASPLPSNEALRCPPGQTIDCGVLLSGESGVIVDPDTFRIDLFLGREFLLASNGPVLIGDPVSGPSLIQGLAASVSANNGDSDNIAFGAEFNTLASIGRTSFASRIFGDNERGLQLDEAYVQNFSGERRVAAGLFTSQSALAMNTLRVAGAQISSFYGGYLGSQNQLSATALEVVLPRPARVEIYRGSTLVSSINYPGGLQILDTSRLPSGSYPVRVVATDASGVVLDEVRTFTRAEDLPPPGKTVYSLSAGVRMADNFATSATNLDTRQAFLPESTDEFVVTANASRRIAPGVALGGSLTAVGSDLYPEASLQAYHDQFRGFVSIASGPESQHGAVAGVGAQFGDVNASLDFRVMEASPAPTDPQLLLTLYRPFLRDERSVNASVNLPFFDGALSFRGSYGDFEGMGNRYVIGTSYNRPVETKWFGSGFLSFDASVSDVESRIGVRLSFTSGRSTKGAVSTNVGAEYIKAKTAGGPDGVYPIAQVGYSRAFDIGNTLLATSALAGFANGDLGAQGSMLAQSGSGELDISAGVTRPRDTDRTDAFLTGNLKTGFVYGDGAFHFGNRGFGDAAVLVKLDKEDEPGISDYDGRFRVVVDDVPYDALKPGQRMAISLPSFSQPKISLSPDAAPPFEIDLSARETPLYPGNVVSMTWNAVRVVTAYGRLLDSSGKPLVGVFVSAGSDIALTGEGGYFSLTAPIGSSVSARAQNRSLCDGVAVLPAPQRGDRRSVVALGALTCNLAIRAEGTTNPGELAEAEGLAISLDAREQRTADVLWPALLGTNSGPGTVGK